MAQVMAVMAIVSAVSSIAGGMSKQESAKKEAYALENQALLASEESRVEAQIHATRVRKFAQNQKGAYLKNGVTLDGSPLLVLDETYKFGQQEVDAIVRSGNARSQLYRDKASIARSEGRAALLGGIGSGVGSLASRGMAGSGSGLFGGGAAETNGSPNTVSGVRDNGSPISVSYN